MNKGRPEEETPSPMIHGSGIYSIIRRSPVKTSVITSLLRKNPQISFDKNVNIRLSSSEKERIIASWNSRWKRISVKSRQATRKAVSSITLISMGRPCMLQDHSKGQVCHQGTDFPVPQVIPPLHLGCGASYQVSGERQVAGNNRNQYSSAFPQQEIVLCRVERDCCN